MDNGDTKEAKQEQKTLKDFSLIELESFAYKTMRLINRMQGELQAIETEINGRPQPKTDA